MIDSGWQTQSEFLSIQMTSEQKELKVLAAVIERSGLYLVCRRPEHKRHGGLWEFPGGKLEEGESLKDAAVRELEEELGLKAVSIGETYLEVKDGLSPFLVCFTPVEAVGDPVLTEHSALSWVRLIDLPGLPLAPCDRKFAEYLSASQEHS